MLHVAVCGLWLVLCILACAGLTMAQETGETFGCEANPTGDPIGGGPGYRDIKTGGDFTVKTADELLAALRAAKPGQVVFVPDGVEMDLTGQRSIPIPGGVTLAGTRGLKGSLGARLFDTLRQSHTLMTVAGRNVRITGLRFEGPYGEADRVADHNYFLSVGHSDTEVDNCEISKFNCVGIGVSSFAINVRIHHNYIHHCQLGGLGYGVSTSSSDVRIIANKFDFCRHHIASSGSPGSGYEAAWNLVGLNATSHHFDMHGGRDRGDSTDIAGDWMHVHHNTFQGKHAHVVIR
ncbi:MAG: hypothetical protein FJ278_23935, partial [Planctomycetes bacterium]|nr:hypothetical protein [Planctomycetota bacterium]